MGNFPKISVVVPVYNCEKYIGQTVESILNQPYQNIRIVLVNDGSVDSSPKLCDQYAAQYDRVSAIHQKNAGVSAARNAGIAYVLSNGGNDTDYIAFLDADDKWIPGFFTQDILWIFEQKYEIIGFQSARCNTSVTRCGVPVPLKEGLYQGGTGSVWLNATQHFGSAFYSVSVIQNNNLRFMEGLKINEDIIFSMQCKYLTNSFYLHNKLLYLYRNNPASVSHSKKKAVQKYEPIINAYLKSDSMMAAYATEQRGKIREGAGVAAVYIMDAHQEHYQQFGSKKDMDRLLERNPHYVELITSSFVADSPNSGQRWVYMQAHPLRYRMKCYRQGITSWVTQLVYFCMMQIPPVARSIEKRRYPMEIR